jgi:hypothetical protein
VAEKKQQPSQKTQPAQGKPIDIPVLKRGAFDKLLKRASKRTPQER